MKSVKLVSVLAAAAVLTACSQSAKQEPAKPVETTKSVAYSCLSKKSVTAVYTFADQNPVSAVVKVGKKGKEIMLPRDTANQDFVSFADEKYVWNVDTNLNLAGFDQAGGAMLTQKGKTRDKILAKLCEVNKKATAKLNK